MVSHLFTCVIPVKGKRPPSNAELDLLRAEANGSAAEQMCNG